MSKPNGFRAILSQWIRKGPTPRRSGDSDAPAPRVSPGAPRQEKYFRAIYEHAPIMINSFSEDGVCRLWNKECERRLGFSHEEIKKQEDPLALCYPDEEERRRVWDIIKRRDGQFREFRVRDKTGRWHYQMWANFALPDGIAISIGYDVTRQRLSENRMRKLNQCFLSFSSDPVENLNKLTALCGELLGADAAFYNCLEEDLLTSWATWNVPPDFQRVSPARGHVCTDVITKSQEDAVYIRDLPSTEYALSDPVVKAYQLRTYLGQRIMFEGNPIGVLCAVFKSDFAPTQEDKELIKLISGAVAIEEKRRQANETLAKRLEFESLITDITRHFLRTPEEKNEDAFAYAIEKIGRYLGADRSHVLLASKDQHFIRATHEWCAEGIASKIEQFQNVKIEQFSWFQKRLEEEGVIKIHAMDEIPRDAYAERQLFDAFGIRSLINVPIYYGQERIGIIGLQSVRRDVAWSQDAEILLEILAGIIGNALERKRLGEEQRQKELRFELQKRALLEMTKHQILENEDLDVVMRDITEIAAKTLDVHRAGVWRYDKEAHALECVDLYELDTHSHSRGHRQDLSARPDYFRLVRQEHILGLDDVMQNREGWEALSAAPFFPGVRAVLGGEIVISGEPFGLVSLEHMGEPRHWTVEEKSFVRSVCDAVALSINQQRRKQAEEALRASEATLSEVLRLSPNFIFAKDINGRFILVNEAVAEAYGTTVADLIGKTDADFSASEEEARNFRKDDLEVIQSGKKKFIPEEKITDSTGRVRYLQTTKIPFTLPGTDMKALLGVSVDISLRRKAEENLRKSEQKYRNLVETSRDLIWSADADGRWNFVNRAAEEIYGYTPEQMTGRSILDFVGHEHKELENSIFQEIRKGLKYIHYETQHRAKNGTPVYLRFNSIRLEDEQGCFVGMAGTATDITQRKTVEQELERYHQHLEELVDERTRELRQSERLAATGRLAASLAHEINNPLQGIMTHLEILRESLPPNFQKIKNYEFVKGNIEKISQIVTKLLDTYRIPEQHQEEVRVHDVLDKVLALIEHQFYRRNISVRREFADNLPVIQGWPQQLHQVFLNLLLNAHDSMPGGGQVTITTMHDKRDIRVVIKDEGEGMDSKVLENIFDPFFTTKAESGTGLGLFVCQGIVREHGGKIKVMSKPGKGSEFTVFLPIGQHKETSNG